MVRFVFLTGGVISSLGKGTTAASLGALFIARGVKTSIIKIDGYLNVDAGLMSPYEHGEVFVTHDGAETDCDIGHYERFLHTDLSQINNLTSGKIYLRVLEKERHGHYLGKTVQIIPHVSNEIREWIENVAKDFEMVIIELGGVAGEVESIPFLDAMRQIWLQNRENAVFLHLALLPFIQCLNEYKTKPVQHSVRDLLSRGVQPDMIICRTPTEMSSGDISKISMFTNVEEKHIFYSPDVKCKYFVTELLKNQEVDVKILTKLKMFEEHQTLDFSKWGDFIDRVKNQESFPRVRLGFVRKYVTNSDTYVSMIEDLNHAAIRIKINLEINYIDADDDQMESKLAGVDCILVPGGWGSRGTEGKICAIRYARERDLPFFGICLGFQLASVEYARNVLGLEDANSTEMNPECKNPIIIEIKTVLKQERDPNDTRFVMPNKLRVGARKLNLQQGSLIQRAYQQTEVLERFRHRYSFNTQYREAFEKGGVTFGGINLEDSIDTLETFEIKDKKFFVGVQYHPEFLSKPFTPHPLFVEFLKAANESTKKE